MQNRPLHIRKQAELLQEMLSYHYKNIISNITYLNSEMLDEKIDVL